MACPRPEGDKSRCASGACRARRVWRVPRMLAGRAAFIVRNPHDQQPWPNLPCRPHTWPIRRAS